MPGIDPLSAVPSLASVGGLQLATPATSAPSGTAFSSVLGGAVQNLSDLQHNADSLAVKAVTGDLTDIHQATLAATRAQVTMELVSAVRNKGVEAFTEIMRMQA